MYHEVIIQPSQLWWAGFVLVLIFLSVCMCVSPNKMSRTVMNNSKSFFFFFFFFWGGGGLTYKFQFLLPVNFVALIKI